MRASPAQSLRARSDRPGSGPLPLRVIADRASWLLMGIVLVVALVVGTVAHSDQRPDAATRVAQLEGELRCPSCVDLSVAESDASTAVAIRHYVQAAVGRGESDQQIISFMESRYGKSILFVPPRSGLGALIWWVPVGLGVLAVGGIGVLFVTRRRARPAGPRASLEDRELVARALGERD